MKTILVPTDFSKAANNAAEYAVNLANDIKAKVVLLHVYHVPIPATDIPMIIITPGELQTENEMRLQEERSRLSKNNIEIEYRAKMGFAGDEILDEGKKSDLIIMGKNGAGRVSEVLIGSIATSTLRKSETPVLIIPEDVKYKAPEKIVFACDYDSRTDLNILNSLKELMKTFNSRVYVLNVKENKDTVAPEKTIEAKIEGKLCDVQHSYCLSESGDLVEGINEFVKDKQADMIAIVPHRYNLLERLFHKSISKKMSFHTHVPLLALPDHHKSISAYLL